MTRAASRSVIQKQRSFNPRTKLLPALEDAFQASVERGSYVWTDLHQLLSANNALPLLAREPGENAWRARRKRLAACGANRCDKRTVRIRR